MLVRITRSGGFVGISESVDIDTEKSSPEVAEKAFSLVQPSASADTPGHPDSYQFGVTVLGAPSQEISVVPGSAACRTAADLFDTFKNSPQM